MINDIAVLISMGGFIKEATEKHIFEIVNQSIEKRKGNLLMGHYIFPNHEELKKIVEASIADYSTTPGADLNDLITRKISEYGKEEI